MQKKTWGGGDWKPRHVETWLSKPTGKMRSYTFQDNGLCLHPQHKSDTKWFWALISCESCGKNEAFLGKFHQPHAIVPPDFSHPQDPPEPQKLTRFAFSPRFWWWPSDYKGSCRPDSVVVQCPSVKGFSKGVSRSSVSIPWTSLDLEVCSVAINLWGIFLNSILLWWLFDDVGSAITRYLLMIRDGVWPNCCWENLLWITSLIDHFALHVSGSPVTLGKKNIHTRKLSKV